MVLLLYLLYKGQIVIYISGKDPIRSPAARPGRYFDLWDPRDKNAKKILTIRVYYCTLNISETVYAA